MSLNTSVLQALEIPLANAFFIYSLKRLIVQCYQVNAKYKEAKNVRGIRAALYKYSEEHQACYSLNRSKSIWYEDGSADLNVALWFKEESRASDFRWFLETWHQRNPIVVKSGDVMVEERIEEFLVEKNEFYSVLLSHYNAADSESPVQSLDEFDACQTSVGTAVSYGTPLAQLQSIEDSSSFLGLKPYICRIKPKAKFDKLKVIQIIC